MIVFTISRNFLKETKLKKKKKNRLGGSLCAVEALDVALQLLLASLDLVATPLSVL